MFEGIIVGLELEATKTVKNSDSAKKYGSGLIDVFSTPALVAFAENTCMNLILKFLPKAYTTVGYEVNIKHLKATPIGMNVKCSAKLIEVDARKLSYEFKAYDENGLIGEGTHIRFIVDKKKFLEKINIKNT